MGPKIRLICPEVPQEELIWQDPIPVADYPQIDDGDVADLKTAIANSGGDPNANADDESRPSPAQRAARLAVAVGSVLGRRSAHAT